MLYNVKIRQASWQDREGIQPLRRLFRLGPDGGLYELLNWPIFHVNVAVHEGTVVGYSASVLLPGGVSDGNGLVVQEGFRRNHIGTMLYAARVRDLLAMGWEVLYAAVPEDIPEHSIYDQWFGKPLGRITVQGMSPCLYYGTRLDSLSTILAETLGREPFPLRDLDRGRLLAKADSAQRELIKIGAYNEFMAAKAALRSG